MTGRSAKPPPNSDDPKQSEQFIETARRFEVERRREKFERAFAKAIVQRPTGNTIKKK